MLAIQVRHYGSMEYRFALNMAVNLHELMICYAKAEYEHLLLRGVRLIRQGT
jgi:hypothetical protein